jgi:hypothetical protein
LRRGRTPPKTSVVNPSSKPMQHRERVRSRMHRFDARDRLCRYMRVLGYEGYKIDDALVFERSYRFGFLPGSPPRTWESRLVAMIDSISTGSDTKLEWTVTTNGRMCGRWDIEYFLAEIRGSVRAVAGTQINLKDLNELHERAVARSAAAYGGAFLFVALSLLLCSAGVLNPIWCIAGTPVVALLLAKIQAPQRRPVTWCPKSFRIPTSSNEPERSEDTTTSLLLPLASFGHARGVRLR